MTDLTDSQAPDRSPNLPAEPTFDVASDDIVDGQPLGPAQVAEFGNTSPHLRWSGAPEGTKSYVVTCFDPDAPTPHGFWHWVLVDLPASVTELPAGAASRPLPEGAFHVRNDAGERGFLGAAPPKGDGVHRYLFVVHAVGEETLGVSPDVTPVEVSFTLAFASIGHAVIQGTYQR